MIVLDPQLNIIRVNECALTTFEYTDKGLLGQHLSKLIPGDSSEQLPSALAGHFSPSAISTDSLSASEAPITSSEDSHTAHRMGSNALNVQVCTAKDQKLTCSIKIRHLGTGDWLCILHDVSEYRRKELFNKVQMAWLRSSRAKAAADDPPSQSSLDIPQSSEQ